MGLAFKTFLVAILLLPVTGLAHAQQATGTLRAALQPDAQKRLKTLTYKKRIIWTDYNRKEESVRQCAHELPDKFRQDIDMGNGFAELQLGDRKYQFKKFKSTGTFQIPSPFEHYLLFELNADNLEHALERFKKEGIALDKGYITKWKGRKVRIIGTAHPDSTITQVWFDDLHHFPVRFLYNPASSRYRFDYQFDMRPEGGFWVPEETREYRNSRIINRYTYQELKINPVLDIGVFDPEQFAQYLWYNE